MEVTASLKSIRVTPQKMGLVCNEVRGKDVGYALNYLKMSPRKNTAGLLYKLLRSAVANAEQKGTMDVDNLVVKRLLVGQGPTLKRWRARAKGAATRIEKRTSHVSVALAEK